MKVGIQDEVLYLGFGSIIHKVKDLGLQKTYLTCLNLWKTPYNVEQIKTLLSQKRYTDKNICKVVEKVLQNNYVIDVNVYCRDQRYSRHMRYFSLSGGNPKAVQSNLHQSHVIILGCGGIGNMVGVCLATSGVGYITLVDNDIIEMSNLTRQFLFTNHDVGQKKVDVLKKALLENSSDVQIDTRVTEELLQPFGQSSLMVVSADSGDYLPLVTRYCAKNKVPFVNVGYIQDIATWGPFVIPGETGCPFCQNVIANDDHHDQELQSMLHGINKQYQAPSTGAINMLSSALSVLDIIKFLGGFGTELYSRNRRVGLWTHDMKIESQNCDINYMCHACYQSVKKTTK